MLTKHAEKRIQQRGKSLQLVNLILEFGDAAHAKGNAERFIITKRQRQEFLTRLKDLQRMIEKSAGVSIIRSAEGQIITIYHNN